MRDAVELEWEGIPAVAVVHEALAGSANSMKKISKMPNYPFVLIKFPHTAVGPWSADEIEEFCEELAPQIVHQLTHAVDGP